MGEGMKTGIVPPSAGPAGRMRFLSVCSGIEAASVAWHPLSWEAVAFAEIEPFPCAVLAHHYPRVPNWGDMTRFQEWPDATVDLLCGGTPCQSFSVAGLRKGLDDPRGNLMLTFGAIAGRYRPRWLVWENVAGVLSSNRGRDFGAFLGLLGLLGYGFAYRLFDAQYFGVPQRRRRVFVVGHLGDWRSAAAVLFERHSLQGHPTPRREAGKDIARPIAAGSPSSSGYRNDVDTAENLIAGFPDPAYALAAGAQGKGGVFGSGRDSQDTFVAHTLRGEDFDASEDGTGRGTPLVPVALGFANVSDGSGARNAEDLAQPITCRHGDPGSVATGAQVRRLTPRECERLQGFPDDYTAIPYRGKPAADGPRYKALGNSWAVPCARWIGERIGLVGALLARSARPSQAGPSPSSPHPVPGDLTP